MPYEEFGISGEPGNFFFKERSSKRHGTRRRLPHIKEAAGDGHGTPRSPPPTAAGPASEAPRGPSKRTSREGGNRHREKEDTANPAGRQGTGRGGHPQKAASAARRGRAAKREPRERTTKPRETATQGRAAGAKRRVARAAEQPPDPGRATPARHGDGGRHTPRQRPAAGNSSSSSRSSSSSSSSRGLPPATRSPGGGTQGNRGFWE